MKNSEMSNPKVMKEENGESLNQVITKLENTLEFIFQISNKIKEVDTFMFSEYTELKADDKSKEEKGYTYLHEVYREAPTKG